MAASNKDRLSTTRPVTTQQLQYYNQLPDPTSPNSLEPPYLCKARAIQVNNKVRLVYLLLTS